jgi:hypothetical protein
MISPSEEQAGKQKLREDVHYAMTHDWKAELQGNRMGLWALETSFVYIRELQAEITRLREQKGRLVGAIQTARLHSNPRLADKVLLDALADDGWDLDDPTTTLHD